MAIEETSLLNETYKTVVLKEYMNKVKNNVCLGHSFKIWVQFKFYLRSSKSNQILALFKIELVQYIDNHLVLFIRNPRVVT